MRTETMIRTYYKFDELPEDAKQKALSKLYDLNVDHEWWEFAYEDAANIGLEITSFDNACISGNFLTHSDSVSAMIKADHGEMCETYKTAIEYEKAISEAGEDAEKQEEAGNEFLKSLLEDYRIMLKKEYEHLTSKEAIIETITINEYEFDIDGNIV